jgi:hypothetical protein
MFRMYAQEFINYLKSQKINCVSLDGSRLNRIIHYYHAYMMEYKQRTYGSKANDNSIDHHKIIALYIKAILVSEPFICDENAGEVNRYSLLANEFFCLSFIEVVFRSWEKDRASKNLCMDKNEKLWLLILLHQYRKFPASLNIISLSQLIYYVEKCFFK